MFYFSAQPYQVVYQCTCCFQSYNKVVVGNSWYSLDKHECPNCHSIQIPSLDIDSPENARELDPNTSFFYSEDETVGLEEAKFNEVDEEFFGFSELTEEVLFVVSKKSSLVKQRGGTYEQYKQLKELADKVDLKLFALMDHAKKCVSSSLSTIEAAHPTQRQQNLCQLTKSLLGHAHSCKNRICHVSHCDQTRIILEYQQLFQSLGRR
jgi:hypothetical protein